MKNNNNEDEMFFTNAFCDYLKMYEEQNGEDAVLEYIKIIEKRHNLPESSLELFYEVCKL